MDIIRDIPTLRARVRAFRAAGERVALVPTMGALHAGHLPLVAAGKAGADRVIASIFVNPRQFGAGEDLARYPRQEADDARMLADARCDLLFAPAVETVYPPGFATTVHVDGLAQPLEGAARPGHFDGVATVVLKLLLMATPDLALFGEKDWQQLQLLRRMVADLDLAVEIVGVPTVRDADGLALSSRNAYLSAAERVAAAVLPQTLRAAAAALGQGAAPGPTLSDAGAALRAAGFTLDYLALADGETLAPLDRPRPGARLFAAARLGATRLIDNLPVPPAGAGPE